MRNSIVGKLMLFLVVAGLLPALLVSYFNYKNAEVVITAEIESGFDAIAATKAKQINAFFDERKRDLKYLAHDHILSDAMPGLIASFTVDGIGGTAYAGANDEVRPPLAYFREFHEYEDILLISPAGDVVFSLAHTSDFGTNLRLGPLRDSELARSYAGAATLLETSVSDFRHYEPSGVSAAFITTPIFNQGVVVGLLSARMGTTAIYDMVEGIAGLGRTGEAIMASQIGNKAVFINPLKHDPEAAFRREVTIGSPNGVPIQLAVQGKKGTGIFVDYRGEKVLAAWRYLPHLRVGMVVKQDVVESHASIASFRYKSMYVGILFLTVLAMIARVFARTISRPIAELTSSAELMAAGDLTIRTKISGQDEIGSLGAAFDLMASSMQIVNDANKEREWLQNGRVELTAKFRGGERLEEVGNSIITFLVDYLGAVVGTIYVVEDEKYLRLIGSRAYTNPNDLPEEFVFGQGLVGQASVEKRRIILTEVPDDYIRIQSGLGGMVPRTILIEPFCRNGVVVGVLELATMETFSPEALAFLDLVEEDIAVAVQTVLSHAWVQALLGQSQAQAEELAAQQEELRCTNESLAEKTRLLEAQARGIAS